MSLKTAPLRCPTFVPSHPPVTRSTSQIYCLDLASGAAMRLTRGDSYNEHPRFNTDGQGLWMTNADNPSRGTD